MDQPENDTTSEKTDPDVFASVASKKTVVRLALVYKTGPEFPDDLRKITHDGLNVSVSWQQFMDSLTVKVDDFLFPDLPELVAKGVQHAPCIVARVANGMHFTVVPSSLLKTCNGRIEMLTTYLRSYSKVSQFHLGLPAD